MSLIKVCSPPVLCWSNGGACGAPPIPGDKGSSSPTALMRRHWSSLACSRSECWIGLSPGSFSTLPSKTGGCSMPPEEQSLCKSFENKEIILNFLENASYFIAVTFSNLAPRGALLPSLFLWKWPRQFGCSQMTKSGGPAPGSPYLHCRLTQTLRLRLNMDAPASPRRFSSPISFPLAFQS